MITGIQLILEERERQIEKEGYSFKHDDEHDEGELAFAAMVYASPTDMLTICDGDVNVSFDIQRLWPWDDGSYNPGDNRIRELVKAGALITAEIDRQLRRERRKKRKGKP